MKRTEVEVVLHAVSDKQDTTDGVDESYFSRVSSVNDV